MALQDPGIVIETPDQERHYYRLGLGEGKFQLLYLRVIVGIRDGRIRTVQFTKTVDLADGIVVHMELGG